MHLTSPLPATPQTSHYPVPCPGCHALSGYARGLQSDGTSWFAIELECEQCPYVWTVHQDMALTIGQRQS